MQASNACRPQRLMLSSGLYLGAVSWFADQQIVVSRAFTRCSSDVSAFALWVGMICCTVALIGLLLSWRALRRHKQCSLPAPADTDYFLGQLSMLMAVIGLLGIILSTSAVLFLQCER